jgi:hypothetical protein
MQDTSKRETVITVVGVIVFFITIPIAFFLSLPKKGDVIKIDCTWSEISPDVTTEMREACRQLRATNNLQKPK